MILRTRPKDLQAPKDKQQRIRNGHHSSIAIRDWALVCLHAL